MSNKFRCEDCGKPKEVLAQRELDGAYVCYSCLLRTDDLTDEMRRHYESKLGKG
jgi:hypothetical protein